MRLLSGIVAFGLVAGLALDDGGFFPVSWGRAAVPLLGLLAVALAAGRPARPGRLGLAALAALGAFLLWTLLSWTWSVAPPAALDEAQRVLVYLAALAAALLLGEPRGIANGVLAASAFASALHLAGADPVGYANGLGALAAVGAALGLGLAVRREGAARWLGAASLALTVPALLASGSQGAWLALAAGFAVALALRRPLALAAAVALAAAGVALAPGNDRPDYWEATLEIVTEEPVLGSGAGTWERGWVRLRDVERNARDAHSLYLETLAELGPLGLAALLVLVAAPLAAARRVDEPYLAAAYTAWAAHAAIDWDWELPAVTLAGLGAGAALLLVARGPAPPLPRPARLGGSAAAAALLLAAAVTLAGQRALADAREARLENETGRAVLLARRAARLMPWSAEALSVRGRTADDPEALREALELDPSDWETWVALARVTDGAERAEALAEARRLNPLEGAAG